MARKVLTNYDFAGNQIMNALAHVIAGDASSPSAGQFWYNSSTGKMMWRNASANIDPLARANHTGTQTASTISDFDSQVRTSRLDQMANPTASVVLNSQKITGLADGTSAGDAVNKGQLDAVANGRDWKDSVRVATTANGTLATAFANGQTVDGVTLATGNRILLKNQSTGSENGIYTVNASGAPTRATDADSAAEVTSNMSVMVEEGTVNADTQWTMTNNGAITLGTTALVFVQTGTGTSYTQGTGISISGGTIAIDTAVVVRKFAQDIGDGSTTAIGVTHNLGTLDVQVQVYLKSTGETVEVDVVRTSTSVVTLTFAAAPASNAYRVVVQA